MSNVFRTDPFIQNSGFHHRKSSNKFLPLILLIPNSIFFKLKPLAKTEYKGQFINFLRGRGWERFHMFNAVVTSKNINKGL